MNNLQTKNVDDEIDILELVGILLAKWPILLTSVFLGTVAGIFISNFLRPAFTSDALLQVDQNGKKTGLAMGELGALLDGGSQADAEIELIKSRRVLDVVVEKERLAYSAVPVAFFPRLLHKEGRVDIDFLNIPESLRDEEWFLVASADSAKSDSVFQIVDPLDRVVLEGRVGETYRIPMLEDSLVVRILSMMASPSEKFLLGQMDSRLALDLLKSQLIVAEQGKKTGIIQMQISNRYADRAASILNTIADTYVRQNVEMRSAEATKTLEFLEKQLPSVKAKLDSSEEILSTYRKEEGSVDLNGEARGALEKRMGLEKQLLELQQKYQEVSRLFKDDHPSIISLKKQQAQIRREMANLSAQTKDLPEKQQEILRKQGDVEVNSSIYTSMLNNIQQLRVVQAGEVGNVRIVDRARVELKTEKPSKKVIFLGCVGGGFLLGVCFIFFLRMLSSRGIRSSRDVERETGVSVYAKIPETKRSKHIKKFSIVEEDSDDAACEALRTLRTSLEFSIGNAKTLLVTGVSSLAGKSFISKNLSALYAMNGKRVLLIDTDFRASTLSPLGRKCGLSDYLLKKISLDEAIQHLEGAQIDLIGAGSYVSSPSEMLSSKAFENLLKEMREKYDLVIIDSAPLLVVADAQIESRYADFVLVVVRYAYDSNEDLHEALSALDKANVEQRKALVFNRCIYEGGHGGYGKSYGYGKYGDGHKHNRKKS